MKSRRVAVVSPCQPSSPATDRIRRLVGALLLAGLAVGATGCATVAPRERGTLNDYTMRADRDKVHDAMTEHVHFSREAVAGGRGVGGGGCGCN